MPTFRPNNCEFSYIFCSQCVSSESSAHIGDELFRYRTRPHKSRYAATFWSSEERSTDPHKSIQCFSEHIRSELFSPKLTFSPRLVSNAWNILFCVGIRPTKPWKPSWARSLCVGDCHDCHHWHDCHVCQHHRSLIS